MEEGLRRRRYLLAITTGAGTGLAGCAQNGEESGSSPSESGDRGGVEGTSEGSTSVDLVEFPTLDTDADPTFRQWLPAKDDDQLAGWGATHLARYRDARSTLPAEEYESATDFAAVGGYLGIEFEAMEGLLNALSGPGTIYPGSFDREAIEDALSEMNYEQYDSGNDVTFYERSTGDEPPRVAISGEGVINDYAGSTDAFADRCTVLFETAAGDRTRLHETDDRFRQYTAAVGWPLQVRGLRSARSAGVARGGLGGNLPQEIASDVVYGQSTHHTDDALVNRYWLWTAEDGDTAPSDVRSALESGAIGDLGTAKSEIAIRTEGQINDVAVITPIENPGGGVNPPLATLRASVADGELTVTHQGGDPVPLGRLTVRAGSDTSSLGSGTLDPGASVTTTVPADASGSIKVVYRTPSGGSTRVIADA